MDIVIKHVMLSKMGTAVLFGDNDVYYVDFFARCEVEVLEVLNVNELFFF